MCSHVSAAATFLGRAATVPDPTEGQLALLLRSLHPAGRRRCAATLWGWRGRVPRDHGPCGNGDQTPSRSKTPEGFTRLGHQPFHLQPTIDVSSRLQYTSVQATWKFPQQLGNRTSLRFPEHYYPQAPVLEEWISTGTGHQGAPRCKGQASVVSGEARASTVLSPSGACSPCSPHDALDSLDSAAVQCVMECVERLAQSLPKSDPMEVKEHIRANKKLSKMIGHICEMSEDNPQKEVEIRKYSAIYGRFDSKRRDGRQLTMHEVGWNAKILISLIVRNDSRSWNDLSTLSTTVDNKKLSTNISAVE